MSAGCIKGLIHTKARYIGPQLASQGQACENLGRCIYVSSWNFEVGNRKQARVAYWYISRVGDSGSIAHVTNPSLCQDGFKKIHSSRLVYAVMPAQRPIHHQHVKCCRPTLPQTSDPWTWRAIRCHWKPDRLYYAVMRTHVREAGSPEARQASIMWGADKRFIIVRLLENFVQHSSKPNLPSTREI